MSKQPRPPNDPRIRLVHLPRYQADCGHRFTSEDEAISHMTRCWKSPGQRTCKTCEFGRRTPYEDDTGAGGEWECRNPDMQEEEFTPAHEKAPNLCINCPKWRPNEKTRKAMGAS